MTSRRAVLIYVGIYSLYVQKSYQAVSDFVAATEIRLQGYVSDAQNRVRLTGGGPGWRPRLTLAPADVRA